MPRQDHSAPTAWGGIDVSKDALDACLLPADGRPCSPVFANDGPGHAAPLAWAAAHAAGAALGFGLGSTGAYGAARATALAEAGRYASVVNPARVKYAGLMRGQGDKADRADARLIAEYATRERPPLWRPAPAETLQLQALARRRDDLRVRAAREKGRVAAPGLTRAARQSIARTATSLAKEAGRLQRRADELTAASATPRADRAPLESTPGVGAVTAQAVLAELPEPSRFASARQAAAYAGLAPREYRSGASVRRRTRLSEAGNARLRKALYLPTLTAARCNPLLRRLFERRVAAGKARMAAVGACMREPLMIAYGVLKNRTPFDPAWARKQPA